ncbi:MAG: hypothetical protein ACI9AT_002282, partial [Ulvibacter sp.]
TQRNSRGEAFPYIREPAETWDGDSSNRNVCAWASVGWESLCVGCADIPLSYLQSKKNDNLH